MRHLWEEPVISGSRGSDAVFFSGCNLRCVFCQNKAISRDASIGTTYTPEEFARFLLALGESDSHSISLITPSHFAREIAQALRLARGEGLQKTVVYNSNGYESPQALEELTGLVDVYLPDFKYESDQLAQSYSSAPGYFHSALNAITEMLRQQPKRVYGEDGLLLQGVLIRHLVLPGCRRDSCEVMKAIVAHFPTAAVSLLRQYTPAFLSPGYPQLNRTVTTYEYESVKETFYAAGLREGFQQEKASAVTTYTPEFSNIS
jgi:putative pyruvate formate lyase activating enzyme